MAAAHHQRDPHSLCSVLLYLFFLPSFNTFSIWMFRASERKMKGNNTSAQPVETVTNQTDQHTTFFATFWFIQCVFSLFFTSSSSSLVGYVCCCHHHHYQNPTIDLLASHFLLLLLLYVVFRVSKNFFRADSIFFSPLPPSLSFL